MVTDQILLQFTAGGGNLDMNIYSSILPRLYPSREYLMFVRREKTKE